MTKLCPLRKDMIFNPTSSQHSDVADTSLRSPIATGKSPFFFLKSVQENVILLAMTCKRSSDTVLASEIAPYVVEKLTRGCTTFSPEEKTKISELICERDLIEEYLEKSTARVEFFSNKLINQGANTGNVPEQADCPIIHPTFRNAAPVAHSHMQASFQQRCSLLTIENEYLAELMNLSRLCEGIVLDYIAELNEGNDSSDDARSENGSIGSSNLSLHADPLDHQLPNATLPFRRHDASSEDGSNATSDLSLDPDQPNFQVPGQGAAHWQS